MHTYVFIQGLAMAVYAERVHRLAYYDSVTGLPNRSLFTEKLLKQLVDGLEYQARAPFVPPQA